MKYIQIDVLVEYYSLAVHLERGHIGASYHAGLFMWRLECSQSHSRLCVISDCAGCRALLHLEIAKGDMADDLFTKVPLPVFACQSISTCSMTAYPFAVVTQSCQAFHPPCVRPGRQLQILQCLLQFHICRHSLPIVWLFIV